MSTTPTNPFVFNLSIPWYRKLQICFMSLTIAPIRVACLAILFIITWAFGVLFTLGLPDELDVPLSATRSAFLNSLQYFGMLTFKIAGFFFTIRGNRAKSKEAPVIVAAPHSTPFDLLLWFHSAPLPAALTKIENFKIPLFGTLVKAIQPVLVVREDFNSRQMAVSKMEKRVKEPDHWPQLIVFPEGTSTNAKSLIMFKVGAFLYGAPVQPITVQYLNSWNTFTLTETGPKYLKAFWLTMCQFWTSVEIEYLPVYKPSLQEITDPKLYAHNVRQAMSQKLNIPCTEHTYQDRMLMKLAGKMGFPKQHICVELHTISKKYNVSISQVKAWLNNFVTMSGKRRDGLVSVDDFAKYLDLPVTVAIHDLFEIYDTAGQGTITFNQYISGHALMHATATAEHTLDFACQVYKNFTCCKNSENSVSLHESNDVYLDMDLVGQQIECGKQELGACDSVRQFFLSNPEYAMLCLWYQLLLKKSLSGQQELMNGETNNNVRRRINTQN